MTEKRKIPAFQSEAEEARWWFENREARDAEFAQAIVDGRAGKNTLTVRVAKSGAAEVASSLPISTPQPEKHR